MAYVDEPPEIAALRHDDSFNRKRESARADCRHRATLLTAESTEAVALAARILDATCIEDALR